MFSVSRWNRSGGISSCLVNYLPQSGQFALKWFKFSCRLAFTFQITLLEKDLFISQTNGFSPVCSLKCVRKFHSLNWISLTINLLHRLYQSWVRRHWTSNGWLGRRVYMTCMDILVPWFCFPFPEWSSSSWSSSSAPWWRSKPPLARNRFRCSSLLSAPGRHEEKILCRQEHGGSRQSNAFISSLKYKKHQLVDSETRNGWPSSDLTNCWGRISSGPPGFLSIKSVICLVGMRLESYANLQV